MCDFPEKKNLNFKKKIGILGGTFDPVHNGHLLIAENACEQFGLEEVWIIPTGRSPHKDDEKIISVSDRVEMLKLAVADNSRFRLNLEEIESGNVNYTYRTLIKFKEEYPDNEFYFIMGADSLETFSTWRHPEIISSHSILLAAVRDDMTVDQLDRYREQYQKQFQADIRFIDAPGFSISSSDIRNRIAQRRTVRYMLPDAVLEYILKQGLYRS